MCQPTNLLLGQFIYLHTEGPVLQSQNFIHPWANAAGLADFKIQSWSMQHLL